MTTTPTLTLTAFLEARLSEDEAAAKEAAEWADGPWYVERSESGILASDRVPVVFDPRGYTGKARTHLDHIARHDPARVLAECEAHRKIVREHEHLFMEGDGRLIGDSWSCQTCHNGYTDWWCVTVRALAAVYSDHAEFREEWRV